MLADQTVGPVLDRLPVLDDDDYATFRTLYLIPNQPVIFSTKVTANWTARAKWIQCSASKERPEVHPDWDYLRRMHGHELVEVISCSDEFEDEGTIQLDDSVDSRHPKTFGELLDMWREGKGQTLYLKDWHLPRNLARDGAQHRIEQELYTVSDCWRDDWMNMYYTAATDDDFRFVYAGGGATFTPLHRDVYASYSISTNICGSKRWYMFPPHLTPELLPLIKAAENRGTSVDVSRWPKQQQVVLQKRGMRIITQQEGETIFVPSGWYHSVVNLTHPTISLNHNWCNAHNITSVYESMCSEVSQCQAAIDDVRELLKRKASKDGSEWREEWEACVSDLVRKSAGWDWMTMWKMIRHALKSQLGTSENASSTAARRWPDVDLAARPPPAFVTEKIKNLLADLLSLTEAEHIWTPGLRDVLDDVAVILDRSESC